MLCTWCSPIWEVIWLCTSRLCLALQCHGVIEKYVGWIQLLYCNVTSVIQCPARTTQPFNINADIHHTSALSLLLFILCIDIATAEYSHHTCECFSVWLTWYLPTTPALCPSSDKLGRTGWLRTECIWISRRLSTWNAEPKPMVLSELIVKTLQFEYLRSSHFKQLPPLIPEGEVAQVETIYRFSLWQKMSEYLKAKIYDLCPIAIYRIECCAMNRIS